MLCTDYDFAANVNDFAAKFSRLIYNDFAAILGFSPDFENVTFSRLNFMKSRLIVTKFAAILYNFAAIFFFMNLRLKFTFSRLKRHTMVS